MNNNSKIIVAGPCAIESLKQVEETCKQVSDVMLKTPYLFLFRAGVWKPRTSPSTFQGIGNEGVTWLTYIQKNYNVPCLTEVISTEHLKLILKHKLSGIWLGARTVTNPILVQSLADALSESQENIPDYILVKNPVSEDIELWIGAVERIKRAIKKCNSDNIENLHIMLVHRGCNHKPCYQMAFDMHKRYPQYPLLLDPSHLTGNANKIEPLCFLAAKLSYNGLMIEVHPNPDEALSDTKQQITPEKLYNILDKLTFQSSLNELLWLRQILKECDQNFFTYLTQRTQIVKQIGEYKRKNNLNVVQSDQKNEVRQWFAQQALDSNLPTDTIIDIYEKIHNMSVQTQLSVNPDKI